MSKDGADASTVSSENRRKKLSIRGSAPIAKKRIEGSTSPLVQTGMKSYTDPTPKIATLVSRLERLEKALKHARTQKRKDEINAGIEITQELLKKEIVQETFKNKVVSKEGSEGQPVELDDDNDISMDDDDISMNNEEQEGMESVVEDLGSDMSLTEDENKSIEDKSDANSKPRAVGKTVKTNKVHKEGEQSSQQRNPYQKKNGDKSFKTIKDAILDEHQVKRKGKMDHRLRISFDCKQEEPSEHSYNEEIKRMTVTFDKVVRSVDKDARLTTWVETDKVLESPKKISPSSALKYVDVPHYIHHLGCKRQFRFGIRVNTSMSLHEFCNTWTKYKNINGWSHIVPAEMQKSSTAYAVGLCQGSSYGRDCTTLNKELTKALGCEVEASWQNITGMEKFKGRMWNAANKAATKEAGEHMPTYNKVKQSLSPSGLIIHVAKREDVRKVMKILAKDYGKSKDSKWPIWPDGSRMKFVPYVPPTSSQKLINMVEERLEWHIYSKAHEVSFDIHVTDIHEEKEYLNGKSLEWEIYNTMSKERPELSVFKNLIIRWDKNPKKICYQVTAYEILSDEAEEAVNTLKSKLHDKFKTNDILNHFPGQSLLTSSYHHSRSQRWEAIDPEIEELINEEKGVDHEGILEPGFVSLIAYEQSGLLTDDQTYDLSAENSKGSNTSSLKKASRANGSGKSPSSEGDNQSLPTQYTKGSNTTGVSEMSSVTWKGGVKDNARQPSEWGFSPRIEMRLKGKGFTSEDFVKWQDENATRIKDVFRLCSDKHRATKQMILLMEEDRKELNEKPSQSDERQGQSDNQAQPHP